MIKTDSNNTRIYSKNEYIKKIKEIISKEDINYTNYSIFVGAGFSVNFGMPNWDGYAKKKLELIRNKITDPIITYATEEELLKLDKKHLLTILKSFDDSKSIEKAIFNNKSIIKYMI